MTRAIIAQRPKRYYYRTGDGKLHWAPYLGITLPGTDTGNEKLVPPDTSPSHRNRSKSGRKRIHAVARRAFVPTHEFLMESDPEYAAARKALAVKWDRELWFLRPKAREALEK